MVWVISKKSHGSVGDGVQNDGFVDNTWRHSVGRSQLSGVSCIRSCVIFLWHVKIPYIYIVHT